MAEPNPTEVAPWYLRNITEALELDTVTGQVHVRSSIVGGNVTIAGNIIVSNVTVDALGNIDLTNNTLPVTVDSGNITVYQGTDPWMIEGNVNANVTGAVDANITGGNVTVYQGTDPWNVAGSVNANVTGGNIIVTPDFAQLTAFQEPLAITITPVIQADAVYGLDPENWVTTELNNGNVTVDSNSTWLVQSGTSAGGYARLATTKYMTYQPGQGSMFRWTAAFTADGTTKDAYGVDNIVQNTGPIDREDGYSVGYSGATDTNAHRKIGFLHRRGGVAEKRQLTVTTAPTGTQTATITLNGQAFTITLTASTSTQYTATQIATLLKQNTVCDNTWDIEACDSVVTFIYYSPGPKIGSYNFSVTGSGTLAVATFSRLAAGQTPSDTWTYVDNWDNQAIQFDPTKLNVFGLDFRWLGAGIVRLFMEDPATGEMTLVHTQKFASTQTYPHLTKPSLRLTYRSGTTNSAITPGQNVVVRGSSVMAAVQGQITQTSISQSYFNLDTTTKAKDTVWHLLSIQNPLVRGDQVNKQSLIIQDLTVSAQGNDPSIVYVIKNCVGTSNLLVYNPVPGQTQFKFAQYSVSAVTETLASDSIVLTQAIGINGSSAFNMEPYNLTLAPGETVSVFISSTNALNRTGCGITWKVD